MRVTDATPGSSLARDVVDALRLLVPVVDAADERRDQRHAGLGAGHGLGEAEQQRQVAVDAFALEPLGGADAFPGAGDLDQDALARRCRPPRTARSARAPWRCVPSVSKLRRASTSVETRPGNDLEDLAAEVDEQLVHERVGRRGLAGVAACRTASASSTSGRYCGFCAALRSSDGFVVASCGVYCAIASMSPVSATITECRFRLSSCVVIAMPPDAFRAAISSRARPADRCRARARSCGTRSAGCGTAP